jgi:hypothetical protein
MNRASARLSMTPARPGLAAEAAGLDRRALPGDAAEVRWRELNLTPASDEPRPFGARGVLVLVGLADHGRSGSSM